MADNNGVPRRKPVPQRRPEGEQAPLPENWAADLTLQFRRTLSTKRMNELSRSGSRKRPCSRTRFPTDVAVQSPPPLPQQPAADAATQTPPPPPSRAAPQPPTTPQPSNAPEPPPAYSSLKNLPNVPTPPSDQKGMRFRHMLMGLSSTPLKWENPGLLDEALMALPLQRIYDEAQEESDILTAEAASLGPSTKPAWGYQDCVIRALMKWFRSEFFEWVNNPKCSTCRSPTVARGMAAPLPDEAARGASRVELYQCAHHLCQSFERFPRYNDAFVLMQTRRGRCGEWANCFSMLCRAVGGRVRWIWNAEDHVWTEIYSEHRKRWVHVDSCEGAWDAPLLYTQGWGKKLSYAIAFSAEGCADVTRRYVRNTEHSLPRNRSTEGVLMHIVAEINSMRRNDLEKKNRFQLQAEDMREDAELRKFIIEAIAFNVGRIAPGGDGEKAALAEQQRRNDPDAQKAAEGRQSGNPEWIRARGEDGQQQNQTPTRPRDQRQQ